MPITGNQIIGEFIKLLSAKTIEFSIVDNATQSVSKTFREELSQLIASYPDWSDETVIMAAFPKLQRMLSSFLDVLHVSVFRNHAPESLVSPSQTVNPLDYTSGTDKTIPASCIIIRNVLILLYRIACIAAYRKTADRRFLKAIELITPDTNVQNSIIADITLDITKGLYDVALGSIERFATIS